MTKKKAAAAKPTDFEHALEQLEAITASIEQGDIGLEASLSQYEQGIKLIKQCHDTLLRVEQRIEELSSLADAEDPDLDESMDLRQAD
jgi:exodeoxyribonuclease VII small subunit